MVEYISNPIFPMVVCLDSNDKLTDFLPEITKELSSLGYYGSIILVKRNIDTNKLIVFCTYDGNQLIIDHHRTLESNEKLKIY